MDTGIFNYRKLREETDLECRRLEKIHSAHLVCRTGCTACCMDFSIFPVEYYSIANETAGKNIKVNRNAGEGECVFLTDGLCSVYESRPLICRTHGLPLLGMGDEEWELSHCHLNFTGDAPDFDESNTFPHDRYNSRLFMINREFVSTFADVVYQDFDLIPLSRLISDQRRQGEQGL